MKSHYQNLEKITIIGGGTAGHLSVLFLTQKYPNTEIIWIYPEENNPIGVGEATIPYVQNFLTDLGIDVETVLTETDGSIKLGLKFIGFFDETVIHPFIDEENDIDELYTYLIHKNIIPLDILNYDAVASHMYITKIYKLIQKMIIGRNLKIIRRKFIDSDLKGLVLDCTGFNRLVLNKFNNVLFKDPRLFNNTALITRINKPVNQVCSTFYRLENGWVWEIPLKYETSYGFVYNTNDKSSSKTIDASESLYKFLSKKHPELNISKDNFKSIDMISGRNEKHFIGDDDCTVLGIGLSSMFVEPLESTGLFFTVHGLDLLKEVLDSKITEDEYTSIINLEFDATLEFILMHFKDFDMSIPWKEQYCKVTQKINYDYILDPEKSKFLKIDSEIFKVARKSKNIKELYKQLDTKCENKYQNL